MTPRNNAYSESNTSGLITWTGECVPCLGIKTGDNLNLVVYTIAEKICELTNPLDLSSLTLQCALDIFEEEETGNRTLVKVLQLLIDNECGLKELIDNIQTQIDGIGSDNLVLDLKCLKELDSFGNALPYNQQSVLQSLINEVCDLKSDLTTLSGRVTVLQNTVDNLDIPSGDEVIVTTTISGPKVVSEALKDVSKDYTDYKTILGTTTQIQTAIGRQTSAMNTLMSGVTGWVTTPTTQAQWLNNMGLLLTNLVGRVAANEQCCSSGCEDIQIGFIPSFEGHTVILQFTSGAGTYIPLGYEDCGSTLTITNALGTSFSVPLTLSQGFETEEIDLSLFTKGDVLDFNIDLKMCKEGETCQKCINKAVKYLDSGCCVLTNNFEEDIILIYTVPLTTT